MEGYSRQRIKEVVREEYEQRLIVSIVTCFRRPNTLMRKDLCTEQDVAPGANGRSHQTRIKRTYQAEPQEFYAKFQVIKTALRQKQPGFFYANGNIRRKAARRFLRSAMKYLDWGEIDIYADVVDKSKVDEFKLFMDMLV